MSTLVGLSHQEVASYEFPKVTAAVQAALHLAGIDFGAILHPHQTVVLKPNWISGQRESRPNEWEQIITHPSILRAVLTEVSTSLKEGRVVIADAPQTDSDFSLIEGRSALDYIIEQASTAFPDIDYEVIDLRREYWIQKGNVTVERRALPGDPRGGTVVDLAGSSEFVGHANNHQYYGADYDFADTRAHHSGGKHEYFVSSSVLSCDMFINLPKLKTHKKAGITVSLKNLVGINADKNYLPHHSLGSPSEGGDEFPYGTPSRRLETYLSRAFKALIASSGGRAPVWGPVLRGLGLKVFGPTSRVTRSGNWWGNDTLWRMCLDLNKVLLWYDATGTRMVKPRQYVSIVDGIVAGEGNGPVDAEAVPLGIVLAGSDPLAVDLTCCRLMGFDWHKIPVLRNCFHIENLPVSTLRDVTDVSVATSFDAQAINLSQLHPAARFKPHFGWLGHIELEGSTTL